MYCVLGEHVDYTSIITTFVYVAANEIGKELGLWLFSSHFVFIISAR